MQRVSLPLTFSSSTSRLEMRNTSPLRANTRCVPYKGHGQGGGRHQQGGLWKLVESRTLDANRHIACTQIVYSVIDRTVLTLSFLRL